MAGQSVKKVVLLGLAAGVATGLWVFACGSRTVQTEQPSDGGGGPCDGKKYFERCVLDKTVIPPLCEEKAGRCVHVTADDKVVDCDPDFCKAGESVSYGYCDYLGARIPVLVCKDLCNGNPCCWCYPGAGCARGYCDCTAPGDTCTGGACYYDGSGTAGTFACAPSGSKFPGEPCGAWDECIPGAQCLELGGVTSCFRICTDACHTGECVDTGFGFEVCVPTSPSDGGTDCSAPECATVDAAVRDDNEIVDAQVQDAGQCQSGSECYRTCQDMAPTDGGTAGCSADGSPDACCHCLIDCPPTVTDREGGLYIGFENRAGKDVYLAEYAHPPPLSFTSVYFHLNTSFYHPPDYCGCNVPGLQACDYFRVENKNMVIGDGQKVLLSNSVYYEDGLGDGYGYYHCVKGCSEAFGYHSTACVINAPIPSGSYEINFCLGAADVPLDCDVDMGCPFCPDGYRKTQKPLVIKKDDASVFVTILDTDLP